MARPGLFGDFLPSSTPRWPSLRIRRGQRPYHVPSYQVWNGCWTAGVQPAIDNAITMKTENNPVLMMNLYFMLISSISKVAPGVSGAAGRFLVHGLPFGDGVFF